MSVYDYDQIRTTDIPIIVTTMQLGVGILTLPKIVAEIMGSSDGWLVILISGIVMLGIGALIGQVINRFPGQSLLSISNQLLGIWITRFIFLLLALIGLAYLAVVLRITGMLAKLYFFDLTPIEVLILIFALVIIYCVAGLRIAIMRICLLFLPIIIGILIIIFLFNLGHMRWDNLEPYFTADWRDIVRGTATALPSYNGIIIFLFYGYLAKTSPKIPRMIMIGTSVVITLYILVFIFSVGVLGLYTTINTIFPTIEMAKEAEVPGGFFERLQSIFFAVWMLAIFTSGVFALDISTMMLESIFQKVSKITWILSLAPIGYFLSMIPRNEVEILSMSSWAAIALFAVAIPLPIILLIADRVKRRTAHG